MEEGILHMSNFAGNPSDAFMDFDYMDELLLEGCWLEAKDSDFPNFDYTTPISPFEPSFVWPALEAITTVESGQDERQRPSNLSITQSRLGQAENYSIEQRLDSSKRWWIGPRPSMSVMERLIQALGYVKNCSGDKNVLIQVWVPVTRGGERVLTTSEQPFELDLNCPNLSHYRKISVNYQFAADADSREAVGLPGRVFRNKVPEWTPDVRFFSQEEYPRVGHARQYDVRGTLAVPVLEHGSHSCLGVIEVVLTQQKIQYRPELESVCKALEAVDLTSTDASKTQKTCDLSYQAVLPEILEVLRCACESHRLPLAQTWVACTLQGTGGCMHSDENLKDCIAPVDSASYVGDSRIQAFHEACGEHHLLKGQGIVGTAFQTNQPCFSPNVSACSKTDYPLSHHARMFGLKAAVAIRLRSTRTGSIDYVLEFFLPTNCNEPEEHMKMLTLLSTIIQNVCQTLRVVSDKELLQEHGSPDRVVNCPVISIDREVPEVNRTQFPRQVVQEDCSAVSSPFGIGKSRETKGESSETRVPQRDSSTKDSSCDGSSMFTNRTGEKRRVKSEKTITLPVLRQHFAGSLKDAAKNLGVCPTTLKRICRHYGIQRWPSRKIKKVGHSLQKIQRVIDSVQGTSGALQIESFYSSFPELAFPNTSRTTAHYDNPNEHLESSILKSPGAASASTSPSSSCSQSSNSSQCYSSGPVHPNPSSLSVETTTVKQEQEPVNGTLKRARSDANLHLPCDEPKPLPRSQSHVSFCWPDKQENITSANGQERVADAPRIKVTHGEDMIRFRMQHHWRYTDLLHEISRRFGVDNEDGYHLKYLDDDAEWVLLTCDADLEECIDVCSSSRNQTIRLSFLPESGRSFSFRGPSL